MILNKFLYTRAPKISIYTYKEEDIEHKKGVLHARCSTTQRHDSLRALKETSLLVLG